MNAANVWVPTEDTPMRQHLKPPSLTLFHRNSTGTSDGGSSRISLTFDALKPTRLLWKNLSYEFTSTKWSIDRTSLVKRLVTVNKVLRPQSGEVSVGSLMAIIGPSGGGKSTLLNCVTGRYRRQVSGRVWVSNPTRESSLAFVPQTDYFYTSFTVRETLLLASQLKNGPNVDHGLEVRRAIQTLDIEQCSETRLSKCSGGQLKRVSIVVELISKPEFLVLDEPTSVLDSSTASKIMALLRKLTTTTEKPLAVLVTLHQPNFKLLQELSHIYVLSKNGHNLYNGPQAELVTQLAVYGLVCPEECNPADFVLGVASGEQGEVFFHLKLY